jgi:hypothetical protein
VRRVEAPDLNDPGFWRARLGEKVTMRLRNPGDATDPFTEAVGVLRSLSPDEAGEPVVTVLTRRGEARGGRVSDILAAKLL